MRLSDAPTQIKPYVFHGVEIYGQADEEHIGTCPFCNSDDKLYINEATGQYECKSASCGEKGNSYTFIRKLHELSLEGCKKEWYEQLSAQRGVAPEFLRKWGITESFITGEVIIPSYSIKRNIVNLGAWLKDDKTGKRILYGTPTLKQGLFGLGNWNDEAENVIIAEGPWTGSAVYQMLHNCKGDLLTPTGKLIPTRNRKEALVSNFNVVGVPGCGSFRDIWAPMFADKNVIVGFDNDEPNTTTKKCAGWEGTARTGRLLTQNGHSPKSVLAVMWGSNGNDPLLKKGFDFRDALIGDNELPLTPLQALKSAPKALKLLRSRLIPLAEIVAQNANTDVAKDSPETTIPKRDIVPVHCESYKEVQLAWRKFFKWTDNLDCTLTFMLSVCASTPLPGTQLWGRVFGPPGSGKSRLCESLSISKKYMYPLSSLTGLHSGMKRADGKSCSLIPDMNGKTVIIKDADTLREAGNVSEILAEKRDLFDGVSRKRYRNDTETQEHDKLRITFIVAGTNTMSLIDPNSAARGARYLDSIIYTKGDDPELEADILRRSAMNAMKQMRASNDSEAADARMVRAYELTSGYLHHLRETVGEAISKLEVHESYVHKCIVLGEVVGYMRARPDKQMEDEKDETELATRLTEQFIRLMNCEAIVLNKTAVDDEVMRRVIKVAVDTSRGLHYDICMQLLGYKNGLEGKTLSALNHKPTQKINSICRYMQGVGMLVRDKKHNSTIWKLTPELRELMQVFVGDEE